MQYTRQCGGTSLTGKVLSGACGALGAPPVTCTAAAAYTDPAGDSANAVLGTATPAPSDPAYDLRGGSLATTTKGVVLTTRLKDLAPGSTGEIVEQHFTVRGKGYYVYAKRATSGGVTYTYGTSDATTYRGRFGTTTGTFDDATDVVSTLFPRSALGATPLANGERVTAVIATTRRDLQAVVPDVDTATSPSAGTSSASSASTTKGPAYRGGRALR